VSKRVFVLRRVNPHARPGHRQGLVRHARPARTPTGARRARIIRTLCLFVRAGNDVRQGASTKQPDTPSRYSTVLALGLWLPAPLTAPQRRHDSRITSYPIGMPLRGACTSDTADRSFTVLNVKRRLVAINRGIEVGRQPG
jgi:hypothetical protein